MGSVKSKPKPIPLETLLSEYKYRSEKITTAVRSMALGVIAALWAIFTADGISVQGTGLFGLSSPWLVKAAFVSAAGTLLIDLIQFVAAFWMTNIGVDRYERELSKGEKVSFFYDKEHLGTGGLALYQISFWLFPAKVASSLFAGFSFVALAFAIAMN